MVEAKHRLGFDFVMYPGDAESAESHSAMRAYRRKSYRQQLLDARFAGIESQTGPDSATSEWAIKLLAVGVNSIERLQV